MLSRPSFSIRRLIRPDHQEDDTNNNPHDGASCPTNGARNKTWPKSKRKGPIPTIDIRKSEDLHRIVMLPPLPDTPKSWTSSVHSCDDDKSFTSPRTSPNPPTEKKFPRTLPRSPLLTPKQFEFAQRARSRSLGPPASGPLLPYSPPSSPKSQPQMDDESPICPVDIADAWFSSPPAEEKLWAGEPLTPKRLGRTRSRAYTDNIKDLTRMTDKAPTLRHSVSGTRLPSPRTPGRQAKTSTPIRRTSQRSVRSTTGSTKAQKKSSIKIPLISTPAAFASSTKTKKKQVKRSSRRPRVTTAPASRWTLGESAKDLFNILNKIEADEILPESVLHEIRMSRATQARLARKIKAGNIDTDEIRTQFDGPLVKVSPPSAGPREVEDGGNSMGEVTSSQAPAAGLLVPPKDQATTDEGLQESPVDVVSLYMDEEEPAPLVINKQHPATPTSKPPMIPHRRLPQKHTPLPTIPEMIATGTETLFLSPTSRRKGTTPNTRPANDDFIFLPSTRYTLTKPTFQHGPIRLAKADLPIGQLAAAVDDTLDWTAFQMAIIGGAGDFFDETATDYTHLSPTDLTERDELISWFDEFSFESAGALVPAAEALRIYREEAALASLKPPSKPPPPPPPAFRVAIPPVAADSSLPERVSSLAWRPDQPPPPFPGALPTTQNYMISTTGIGAGQEGVGVPSWLPPPPPPPPGPPPQYHSRASYNPSPTMSQSQSQSQPRTMSISLFKTCTAGCGGLDMIQRSQSGTANPGASLGIGRCINGCGSEMTQAQRLPLVGNLRTMKRFSTESQMSLPQSPMMELVVSKDAAGNEYMVPMGFNLGHDLGDFLRYDFEHVSMEV